MANDVSAVDALTVVLAEAGSGLFLGFATGYAVKKVMKLLLVILGAFGAVLVFLAYLDIVTINYGKLALYIEGLISGAAEQAVSLKAYILAAVPFAGSYLAGFALGFRYG